MEPTTISSDYARKNWREMMELTHLGNSIVIKRYGIPTAAVIPYQDFIELTDVLEELRDIREARAAIAEWEQNPDSFIPWEDVKAEITANERQ
jgi:PHD/YefM family antitoxin component YafN of YafNO toxin-antitoxin module